MTSAAARSFAPRLAALCCAGALLLAFAPLQHDMRDSPPPGYTGGFTEPTCQACHFEAEANTGKGKAMIRGLPAYYAPGGVYRVTVVVTQPGLAVGGFQMSARYEDGGAQAGVFEPAPADRKRAAVTSLDGTTYIHHTADGAQPAAKDTARWALLWTAPQRADNVVFHLAGNAGNDDTSPLGDFIYTTTARAMAGK